MISPRQTFVVATLAFAVVTYSSLSYRSMASEKLSQVDRPDVKAALIKVLDDDLEGLPRLMSAFGEPAVASGFQLLTAPPARPEGRAWLSTAETRAIFEGLRAQPSALRRYLERHVAPEGDVDQRALGLEAMGYVAKDSDFDLLVALADPVDPAASSPLLEERLRATVFDSLREGRWKHDVISDEWRVLPHGVRRAFSLALAESDSPVSAETLVNLLAQKDLEDMGLILNALEQVAKRHPVLGGPNTQAFILPLLMSPDAKLRLSAIKVAAALHLEGAVPELMEFAKGSEADRKSAIDAMRVITDIQLPYDVERWSQWLKQEQEWRVQRLPEIDAGLSSRDPFMLHVSLRELGDHRWGRRETVTLLRPLLRHKDARTRAATAACLGRLMCPSSTEDLLDLLDDNEELVAAAARTALKAVTGQRLPRDLGDSTRNWSGEWRSVAVLPVMLD